MFNMLQTQRVVVAGAIFNNSKFLVLQRSTNDSIFPGKWELPSGKVDFGEDPYEALKREIKEEAGINILSAHPFTCTHYTIEKPDSKRHTVQIVYLVCIDKDLIKDIKLSDEHQSYKWISLEELSGLDTFEDMREILKEAEKDIK